MICLVALVKEHLIIRMSINKGLSRPQEVGFTPVTKNEKSFREKDWNGPGWDKVGIEFTGSQLDPNFLPSLARTNHPSVLVDILLYFYLKEI